MPGADIRVYMLAGGLLFAIGFHALVLRTHLLRRIMALNVMGGGVFLLFTVLAARSPGRGADPVPHAMVLTGIVVAVCATGLALALAQRVQEATTPGPDAEGGAAPPGGEGHGEGGVAGPPDAPERTRGA